MRTTVPLEDAARDHRETRVRHWDRAARRRNLGPNWARGYHERLTAIYRFLVPPGRRVLELGCGPGDLLAAVEPAVGVGVDFSSEMIAWARERHPYLRFVEADVHDLAMTEPFDVIILSDLVNELWDVQRVFERLVPLCTARTRLIVNTYSRLWELPLALVRRLGLATPVLGQNWLTTDDVGNMLDLAGFERLRSSREILWPFRTPLVASLLNRGLVRLWPLDHLALTNFVLARPKPRPDWVPARPTVSVGGAGTERGGQRAGDLRADARDGRRHGARVRGGPLARRNGRGDRAGDRRAPRTPGTALPPGGHRKGRRRATRVPACDRRRPHDPGRRPDGAAGASAALPRRARSAGLPTSPTGSASSTRWRDAPCASSTSWAISSLGSRSRG